MDMNSAIKENISFDVIAPNYDKTRHRDEAITKKMAHQALASLNITNPEDICCLEGGVGSGTILLPFIEAGVNATGVDISKEMLREFEIKLKKRGIPYRYHSTLTAHKGLSESIKVQLIHGSILDMQLEEKAFDLIISALIFHLIKDWKRLIEIYSHLLKQDGFLLIIDEESDFLNIQSGVECKNIRRDSDLRRFMEIYDNIRIDHGFPAIKESIPGTFSKKALRNEIARHGLKQVRQLDNLSWHYNVNCKDIIYNLKKRATSALQVIPQNTQMRLVEITLEEALQKGIDIDKQYQITHSFRVSVISL